MSVRVQTWVWKHSQASGTALLVLLKLADECDDRGQTWARGVKLETIATACRVSVRQARRCCAELEEIGELQRIDQPGRGRPSRYILLAYRDNEGLDPDDNTATNTDTDARVSNEVKEVACDRLTAGKEDARDRVTREVKADSRDRVRKGKADTQGKNTRSPVSGPIDVPSTVPTTTDSSSPTLPPEESGAEAPTLTPQQRAFGRVGSAWGHYNAGRSDRGLPESPPPPNGKLAGMIRNVGGFDRIDDLMRIIRGLAGRDELTVDAVFAKIATVHGKPKGRRSAGRGIPGRAGHSPAEWDAGRRQALEEIDLESREAPT